MSSDYNNYIPVARQFDDRAYLSHMCFGLARVISNNIQVEISPSGEPKRVLDNNLYDQWTQICITKVVGIRAFEQKRHLEEGFRSLSTRVISELDTVHIPVREGISVEESVERWRKELGLELKRKLLMAGGWEVKQLREEAGDSIPLWVPIEQISCYRFALM